MATSFDADAFLATLTERPGVYRMYGDDDELLYVGKARNLKNRVSSYFRNSSHGVKTLALVRQIARMEVTITHTEGEALILEWNLIKQHLPRYNILLRDDKSFPYIFIATEQPFPRISFHRGARREKGRYFGPFPNSWAVRQTLNLLQRVFRVRQCEDSFFAHRTRPCLQYQIQRCKAPCVDYISQADYHDDVRHTVMFLEGKSSAIIETLVEKMDAAAAELNYEQAAKLRDQIRQLRHVQERQYMTNIDGNDADVIALLAANNIVCCQVFFIRNGENLGNASYFPRLGVDESLADVARAFLMQYYANRPVPAEIVINVEPTDAELIAEALSQQAEHKVKLNAVSRGDRARWLQIALTNAQDAIATRTLSSDLLRARFEALAVAFGLAEPPNKIECFDVSHTQGERTVASCVVFDASGPLKQQYRRFNIDGIEPGDDYAAMEQAVSRHFRRLLDNEQPLPELLLIDGGAGQVARARAALEELSLGQVLIVGVSKGPDRRVGQEKLIFGERGEERVLPDDSPALHLIQQIRDEAHRFAITGHRQRRAKARRESTLEEIDGLGPKRRQTLLKQFGGLQGVSRAGVEDLMTVKGISRSIAQRIYDRFHNVATGGGDTQTDA